MLSLLISDASTLADEQSLVFSHEIRQRAFFVRSLVFCGEQGVPYALEYDGLDAEALHLVGQIDDEPVASGRIRHVDGHAKLERIAVRARWRGHGFGHQLTDFMIKLAQSRGFARQKIHAQANLIDFYRRHGFLPHGEPFMEAGIRHIVMWRGTPAVWEGAEQ